MLKSVGSDSIMNWLMKVIFYPFRGCCCNDCMNNTAMYCCPKRNEVIFYLGRFCLGYKDVLPDNSIRPDAERIGPILLKGN